MEREFQAAQLRRAGARGGEIEELLRYNENPFAVTGVAGATLPPPDEPFVEIWEEWAAAARERGAWAVLRERLPQLAFPIHEGVSAAEDYRAATLRGVPPAALAGATGLELERPESLELHLHASPAGRVPVLIARHRPDFVTLLRALGKRNEPLPVPASQGALMLSGYNNWRRIQRLRRAWEETPPERRERATWGEEFARLKPRRELYQDRLILLSDGPYSAVPAAELGLADGAWRDLSLAIRLDHECAHYFTRRLFGAMANNALDELIADYAGLTAATGRFPAAWFHRFLGLEDLPRYRAGARLDLYRGDPPLSDGAFRALQRLLAAAAENLERIHDAWLGEGLEGGNGGARLARRARALTALACLRLEEIASPEADERLRRAAERSADA